MPSSQGKFCPVLSKSGGPSCHVLRTIVLLQKGLKAELRHEVPLEVCYPCWVRHPCWEHTSHFLTQSKFLWNWPPFHHWQPLCDHKQPIFSDFKKTNSHPVFFIPDSKMLQHGKQSPSGWLEKNANTWFSSMMHCGAGACWGWRLSWKNPTGATIILISLYY